MIETWGSALTDVTMGDTAKSANCRVLRSAESVTKTMDGA